jgi:hypothetical protein
VFRGVNGTHLFIASSEEIFFKIFSSTKAYDNCKHEIILNKQVRFLNVNR